MREHAFNSRDRGDRDRNDGLSNVTEQFQLTTIITASNSYKAAK